jgi:hypothetical protein
MNAQFPSHLASSASSDDVSDPDNCDSISIEPADICKAIKISQAYGESSVPSTRYNNVLSLISWFDISSYQASPNQNKGEDMASEIHALDQIMKSTNIQ